MATVLKRRAAVQPDVCMRFPGVGWAGFQHAKALAGESPVRITYANGDLLLMSPGSSHESYVAVFDKLIMEVAEAFRIRTRSLRSTLF
jgi:hypothetical protein